MPRPVLVDTDAGIDDALALLTVLDASQEVTVVGIGSTYGNCAAAFAARNSCCVLEVAGRADVPVAVGPPHPPDSMVPAAAVVHGDDGLGNRSWMPSIQPSEEGSVEQLLRLSHDHEGSLELLALGPLTNLAAALHEDPHVLERCARVVVMGGMGHPSRTETITAAYPNYPVVGDPNVWHNPAAAATVADATGRITWVGMDVTGRVHVPEAFLTEAARQGGAVAEFVAAITAHYADFVTRSSAATERVFTIHDSLAASVLLDQEIALEHITCPVEVDYQRDTRGGLWARATDDGRPWHHCVTEIDLDAVLARLRRVIEHDQQVP